MRSARAAVRRLAADEGERLQLCLGIVAHNDLLLLQMCESASAVFSIMIDATVALTFKRLLTGPQLE